MRLAYFDCFSGITGDMVLGALVHAGADLEEIGDRIKALPVDDFVIDQELADVRGISATRIHVRTRPQGVIRTYASIRDMLEQADLPEDARRNAQRTYRHLADAVARVYGKDVDFVTFHEFGDLDALVEIVGSALALHQLGVERVFSSPVPTGLGMIRTEHGMKPVPSPEVMELLRAVPTYSRGIPAELVNPSGAAILATLSEGYGDMPIMRADRIGYGAGHLRLDFPHALRVVIGEGDRAGEPARALAETEPGVPGEVLVEAILEASEPDRYRAAMHRLLEAGAREAWATPIVHSTGQPGVIVSALAPADRRFDVEEAFLAEPGVEEVRATAVSVSRLPPSEPEGRSG